MDLMVPSGDLHDLGGSNIFVDVPDFFRDLSIPGAKYEAGREHHVILSTLSPYV